MTGLQHQVVWGRGRSITVALVDDDPLSRAAVREALADAGLEVVGEAGNAAEAVGLVLDLRPDVVLMGLELPGSPHLEAVEQISRLAPVSRILILTQKEENRVIEAIIAGASGYILKTAPLPTIIAAVSATAESESVISSQVAGKLLQRIRERDIPLTAAAGDAGDAIRGALTERELVIFSELASGKTNSEIAAELGLSTNTICNHVASILAKLHLENRIQAAVEAVRSGIS
jgi:two-component system, NarL family, response regulator LiaR